MRCYRTGKVCYATAEEAKAAAHKSTANWWTSNTVYPCRFCSDWHFGRGEIQGGKRVAPYPPGSIGARFGVGSR
jgi:hypothetical protein